MSTIICIIFFYNSNGKCIYMKQCMDFFDPKNPNMLWHKIADVQQRDTQHEQNAQEPNLDSVNHSSRTNICLPSLKMRHLAEVYTHVRNIQKQE
jgi:hypothetical protein